MLRSELILTFCNTSRARAPLCKGPPPYGLDGPQRLANIKVRPCEAPVDRVGARADGAF